MRNFLEEFEGVSRKTITRDIDFLRDRFECPIEWSRSKGGWVIEDEGRFELPGVWFEASEVFALLMMLHLVEGVQPGLLEEHLGPLKNRLRRMLAVGAPRANIEHKVKLIHFAPRIVDPKHFQVLASALLDGKKLRIQYRVRDRQEVTERTISPQQLVHYRENWILDAWCHERKALRSFSLEAIQHVQVLDEVALEVSQEEMRDHFQSGYGIFAGVAKNRASLKFSPRRAEMVAMETWHPDQTSQTLNDGSYVLDVPYSDDRELVMDVLRHGPEVEVLAPPELRQKVYETLCAAAKKYCPNPAQ
ncbi:WYL domain-containing protein [Pseudothauera rhizosphaerae]|uniref:WYL domain-containing protein n=2 Tax=Pseudothauera rhizosphaerae TaxID=2565932 RepID=A0A4S4ALK0_9RHOO|nr:WYL domain-containing protein [Pseudothauera rhizosphaerae]